VRDAAARVGAVLAATAPPTAGLDATAHPLLRVLAEELEEFRQDRLVMAGAATLARRESDFRGSIYPLLEAIEEQVTLLRLMSEMVADEKGLAASIGRENEPFGLVEASIVASDYDATGGGARIGLLGPTRMDYPTNFAAVRAVAHYLTRMLEEDESSR
jgi:heat-inducible transcriptional repressor